MSDRTENILSTMLVVAIGIAGALLLAHWAACEQYEGLCAMATLLTRLTERDLDQANAEKQLPSGCDQQGRFDTRPFPDTVAVAYPAEACTEVGADPAGQHRTSPLIRAYLMARRWLF